jgi:hypothetical protein
MEDFEIIDSYTRKQAIADGFQVRIPDDLRNDAGIRYPVFVTRNVWEKYLKVPVEMSRYQDLEGRIWDMLNQFRRKAMDNPKSFLQFETIFQLPDKGDWEKHEKLLEAGKRTFRVVTLNSVIGPMDIDDERPAITIMKPGED